MATNLCSQQGLIKGQQPGTQGTHGSVPDAHVHSHPGRQRVWELVVPRGRGPGHRRGHLPCHPACKWHIRTRTFWPGVQGSF